MDSLDSDLDLLCPLCQDIICDKNVGNDRYFVTFIWVKISILCLFAGQTCLILYHTIPTFNDPKDEGFGKHCGKKKKMLVTSSFVLFPQCFVTLSERNHHYNEMFHLQMLSIWSCQKNCRLVKSKFCTRQRKFSLV